MPNRLSQETSPYLLQHQDNPVDWYPWGDEAIGRARAEEKPIFLSIGYSACHWCHVMEHESFESPAVAELLNDRFVSIKVDREERPDLDQIYMNAVQMLTGRGGWPMSVFLTPELKPFYAGTYFPPQPTHGMPGFQQVLSAVDDAWQNRRDKTLAGAEQLTAELRRVGQGPRGELNTSVPATADMLEAVARQLEQSFDPTYGGFGPAPKFPHTLDLQLLLRVWQRSGEPRWLHIVEHTLQKMAAGGLYDHLGGGFARYSVDARWLVPHFEKMLYDNGLLAATYLEAFQATGNDEYARVVRETLDYVLRDMTDAEGGFYSAEDADSEGVEGKFYTWTPEEVRAVLTDTAAATFARVYDVTEAGNFEGTNILHCPKTLATCAAMLGRDPDELAAELADSRRRLLAARGERVRPGLDDKVLVASNGLMIDAMARAGSTLGEDRYLEGAKRAAHFLLRELMTEENRLLHTWRKGHAKLAAYLDDYACLANALVSLYEATFDPEWIEHALRLTDVLLEHFQDRDEGGFFYTADDHETLIARNKDLTDSSIPAGNSMATTVLVRLGKLTGRHHYLDAADAAVASARHVLDQAPRAAGQLLIALDMVAGPTPEYVLLADLDGSAAATVLSALRGGFLPRKIVAARPTTDKDDQSHTLSAIFRGKTGGPEPTLYICENFACQQPLVGAEVIVAELERRTAPGAL